MFFTSIKGARAAYLLALGLLCALVYLLPASAQGQPAPSVALNEFVSDAGTEWVEIYNSSGASINASNFYLSELTNPGDAPVEHMLPTDAFTGTIAPYGVFTVDVTGLNNGGDSIGLYDNGTLIDRVTYGTVLGYPVTAGLETPPAAGEAAYRTTDGSWAKTGTPTKNALNPGQGNFPITAIVVTGTGGQMTVAEGQTLQMVAAIQPENATRQDLTWSVVPGGTGGASMDTPTGLLTAMSAGTITVKAAANDGSGVSGTAVITITPDFTTLFGTITATLAAQGITTNLADCAPTPTTCSGLWFEKTDKGRVTFTKPLDLTKTETVTFLENLGTKMEAAAGSMKFDARTATDLKDAGATIALYGLDALGYADMPDIVVKDDTGATIDPAAPDFPALTNIAFTPGGAPGGQLSFDTSHFTQFSLTPAAPTFGYSYLFAEAAGGIDADISSTGALYAVYSSDGNVYLKENRMPAELISAGSGPVIAVDSADNIHVLYDNGGLKYKKRTAGVWSAEREVPGGTVFYSMDTDSAGMAHIASDDGGAGGRGHIRYVKDLGAAWSDPIWEAAGWYDSGSGNYYHQPVIRVDSNDKYHLLYEADNWGGKASWSEKGLSIVSDAVGGSAGIGSIEWNTGVSVTKNAMTLVGSDAYVTYTSGGTVRFAKISSGVWNVLSAFAGSASSIDAKNGRIGIAFVNGGRVNYVETTGGELTPAADLGNGAEPVPVVGSRHVYYQDGPDISLQSNTDVPAPITYSLIYTAGTHGSIAGNAMQTVVKGASGTEVTAIPDTGYYFTGWSDGVATAARTEMDVQANLSVTANFAAVTVALSNLEQIYDSAAKPATVVTTPAGLTVDVRYDGSTAAPTDAGTYAVVATITEPGYEGSASGTLVIGKKPIRVVAESRTKQYGDADPAYGYTVSPEVPAGVITGAPARTMPGEALGNYPISKGTLEPDANHVMTFDAGTLTITQRAITITADDKSKVWGQGDPGLTWTLSGGSWAPGDTESVVTGTLARQEGDGVGTYAIMKGTLAANGNYSLSFVKGKFVIAIGSNSSVELATDTEGGGVTGHVPTETDVYVDSERGMDVSILLSAGTLIEGPEGWDGTLHMPRATTTVVQPAADSGYEIGSTRSIDIGFGDTHLLLDTPAKLVFVGQAGKMVGWSQNGVFHTITTVCDSATDPTVAADSECRIDVEGDLVVWTRHFTTYTVYTQTQTQTSGGGGGSGGGSTASGGGGNGPIVGTYGGATPAPIVATQGQVLGAATSTPATPYAFVRNLGVGARGDDVRALQELLAREGFLAPSALTGYFGALTKAAVIRYQNAHGIVPASGYAGPKTRAVLNGTADMTDADRASSIAALQAQLAELQARLKALMATTP